MAKKCAISLKKGRKLEVRSSRKITTSSCKVAQLTVGGERWSLSLRSTGHQPGFLFCWESQWG